MNVRDLGEQGLLQRLQAFCSADLIGDDGAVLQPQAGKVLVVTTDVLVDGVHFSDRTTSPQDAGWRAAAANLSDLAAMGATPLGITVGLGLPGDQSVAWVEALYQGLNDCLQKFRTPIAGGDIVRSPVTTISITAFGEAAPNRVIRRSTATFADTIVVTGYHGVSKAGLELLLNPTTTSITEAQREFFVRSHQRPLPRLDVLPKLHTLTSASIAGMDSSDGLADAVIQVCQASRVGAILERSRLPIPPGLVEWVGLPQATHWTLYGGEDFELVLFLPLKIAQKLVAQLGDGAAIIGRTTLDPAVFLADAGGKPPYERLTLEQGFQHYS